MCATAVVVFVSKVQKFFDQGSSALTYCCGKELEKHPNLFRIPSAAPATGPHNTQAF